MCLPLVAVLLTTHAMGQSSDRFAEVMRGLPDEAKQALLQASVANASGNYQSAIDILMPFSKSEPHPAISLFMGEMYERLQDYENAARAYGSALGLWNENPPQLPGNIFWKYGRSLLKSGRFTDAQPALERALTISGYESDSRVLVDLSTSYRKGGDIAKAYKTALINVCENALEDESWDSLHEITQIEHVDPDKGDSDSISRSWCPTVEITKYERPWNWTAQSRAEAAPAYLEAADKLARLGRQDLSLSYVILCSRAVKDLANGKNDYDPTQLLTVFDEVKIDPPLVAARYIVLVDIVEWQATKGHIGHAVTALGDAADDSEALFRMTNRGTDLDLIARLASRLSRTLFAYVSFDPETGQPRSKNPYEFLGIQAGQAMGDSYGEVSDSEDWANSFSVVVSGHGDLAGKDTKMKAIMETCIKNAKMEIPVKVFLSRLALGGNFEESDPDVEGTPLSQIDAAIKNARPGSIRSTTIEAYVLGRRLSRISAEVERMKPVAVTAVQFSADDSLIVAGGADGKGVLWDQRTGSPRQQLDGAEHVAFSPAGTSFLTAASKTVTVFDSATTKSIAQIDVSSDIESAKFLGESGILVVADESASLYDIRSKRMLRTVHEFRGDLIPVASAAISNDGQYLALGTQGLSESTSYKIYIWDAKTGKEITRLDGHESTVGQLQFSSDGHYLLSGSDDKTVRLWSVASWREVRKFTGHSDNIAGIAITRDAKLVAAASWDNSVIVWNADSGAIVQKFDGNGWWFSGLSFSSDGQQLLAASYDGTIKTLNPNSGEQISSLRIRPIKGGAGNR